MQSDGKAGKSEESGSERVNLPSVDSSHVHTSSALEKFLQRRAQNSDAPSLSGTVPFVFNSICLPLLLTFHRASYTWNSKVFYLILIWFMIYWMSSTLSLSFSFSCWLYLFSSLLPYLYMSRLKKSRNSGAWPHSQLMCAPRACTDELMGPTRRHRDTPTSIH